MKKFGFFRRVNRRIGDAAITAFAFFLVMVGLSRVSEKLGLTQTVSIQEKSENGFLVYESPSIKSFSEVFIGSANAAPPVSPP